MAWTKSIVVVDGDVPVHDEEAVVETMMRRCDFRRDVEFVRGPLDILDHSTPSIAAGTKIGFDATERMRGEETGEVDLAKAVAQPNSERAWIAELCPLLRQLRPTDSLLLGLTQRRWLELFHMSRASAQVGAAVPHRLRHGGASMDALAGATDGALM